MVKFRLNIIGKPRWILANNPINYIQTLFTEYIIFTINNFVIISTILKQQIQ